MSITHQQVWSVHIQRLFHIEVFLALDGRMRRSLHQGFDVVLHATELSLVGRDELPVDGETESQYMMFFLSYLRTSTPAV